MSANFSANGYSTRIGFSFANTTFKSNLSFTATSNVSTSSFNHSARTTAANNVSKALNTSNRPVKGQLYPRL